jgi:large subunit ribosomal protein L29
MKFNELKKKTATDLNKEIDATQFELMRLGAQVATGGAGKDAGRIRELKRKIARIKTLQTSEARSTKTK